MDCCFRQKDGREWPKSAKASGVLREKLSVCLSGAHRTAGPSQLGTCGCLTRSCRKGTFVPLRGTCYVESIIQSWALEVFLNFFNNKTLFLAFFIKLFGWEWAF